MLKFLVKNKKKNFSLKCWLKVFYRLPQLLIIEFNLITTRLSGAKINEFVCIEKFFVRNAKKLSVGFGSFVAKDVHLALHAPIEIGNCCVINAGVKILTASHNIDDPYWEMFSKKIVIMDYAWIAMDAIILPGVTVGRGAVVGAGAVVRNDVPDNCVVAGNPAVVIRKRNVSEGLKYIPAASNSVVEAWVGNLTIEAN